MTPDEKAGMAGVLVAVVIVLIAFPFLFAGGLLLGTVIKGLLQ